MRDMVLLATALAVLNILFALTGPPAMGVATAAKVENAPNVTLAQVDVRAGKARSGLNGAGAEHANPSDDAEATTRLLVSRRLLIPVVGARRASLRDSFAERRGGKAHEAIDIAAPRGTPVVAADDGRVVKLFRSLAGGLTVYQFDVDAKVAYYYAHLDGYVEGLREGTMLKRGDPLGYVGQTGNASADAPHLHFAIFRLTPDKKWWKGTAINPYPLLNDAAQ